MINKGTTVLILATVSLFYTSFASAQIRYQTDCFSPYTTNLDSGKEKTVNLTGYDGKTKTISFIDGPLPYTLLDKIDISAPAGAIPPCEDRQNLGSNSASLGYNDAYITTSQGDFQLGYPKNAYANEPSSIKNYVSGEYTIKDYTSGQYYRYVGFSLTPPFNFLSDNMVEQIYDEKNIIDDVAKTGKINIRIGSLGEAYMTNDYAEDIQTIYPVTASVPATNCIHLSGTGTKSIVFMRDTAWKSSAADFLDLAQNTAKVILTVSPYKEYASKLSFYADLRELPSNDPGLTFFLDKITTTIKNQSSCGNDKAGYILINNKFSDWFSPNSLAATDGKNSNNKIVAVYPPFYYTSKDGIAVSSVYTSVVLDDVFKGSNVSLKDSFAYIVTHELAHAIANVNDEYISQRSAISPYNPPFYSNCSVDPFESYAYSDYLYGSMDIAQCGNKKSNDYRTLYRPSSNSLMRHDHTGNVKDDFRFNIVSCGYIVSSLVGEAPIPDNAKKHFAECATMDTIKDGYRKIVSKPNIFGFGLKTTSATPDSLVVVSSK